MEGPVTWYLGQSWLMLLLSFLLGALVGWWWWRRQWSRVRFTESEAISQVTAQHSEQLAHKDAEIVRLRGLLSRSGPAGTAAGATAAADTDTDTMVDTAQGAVLAGSAVDHPAEVATPALVDLDAVDTASVDLGEVPESIDLTGVEAASVDVVRDAAGAPAVPAQGGAPDLTVTADAEPGHEISAPADSAAEGAQAAANSDADPAAEAAGTAADATTSASIAGAPAAATAGGEHGVINLGHGEAQDESGHDLERVEGIGPRIAGALRASGIHTFGALADADVATLQAALEAAGLRFAPSLPTWARQARLLADGDEAGFLALTEQLVAGRDTGRRP
jgi:predicted flap endonuclease-1-like 5' DNA nuclease